MTFNPLQHATKLTSSSDRVDRWEVFDAECQLLLELTDAGACQFVNQESLKDYTVEFDGYSYLLPFDHRLVIVPHATQIAPFWNEGVLEVYRPASDLEAGTLNAQSITSGDVSISGDVTLGGNLQSLGCGASVQMQAYSPNLCLHSAGDIEIETGGTTTTYKTDGIHTCHHGMIGIVQVMHGASTEVDMANKVSLLEMELETLRLQMAELLLAVENNNACSGSSDHDS